MPSSYRGKKTPQLGKDIKGLKAVIPLRKLIEATEPKVEHKSVRRAIGLKLNQKIKQSQQMLGRKYLNRGDRCRVMEA